MRFIQDPSRHAPKSQNGPNRFLPVQSELRSKTEEAFSLFGITGFGTPIFGTPIFGTPIFGTPIFGTPIFGVTNFRVVRNRTTPILWYPFWDTHFWTTHFWGGPKSDHPHFMASVYRSSTDPVLNSTDPVLIQY